MPLELRHQRTGDIVFDYVDESNPFKKPNYYVYKLIETLLPKAHAKLIMPGKAPAHKIESER